MQIRELVEGLKTAATSPYAALCYIALIAAWVYIVSQQWRLKTISKVLHKLPEQDRLSLLAKEYNRTPRSGLTAEQWIKSRKHILIFFGFVATVVALVILTLAGIAARKQEPLAIEPLKRPILNKTAQSPPITADLRVQQLLEGAPPDPASKVFEVTIANVSTNQIILNKLLLRWRYDMGQSRAIDSGAPLVPVAKYVISMPVDVNDRSPRTNEEIMYPALAIPPRNSSGPSLTTFRLQLHYEISNQFKMHTTFDWDIEFELATSDAQGGTFSLIPKSAWRKERQRRIE